MFQVKRCVPTNILLNRIIRSLFCINGKKQKISPNLEEIFKMGNRGGSNPRPSESQSDALTN